MQDKIRRKVDTQNMGFGLNVGAATITIFD